MSPSKIRACLKHCGFASPTEPTEHDIASDRSSSSGYPDISTDTGTADAARLLTRLGTSVTQWMIMPL